MGDVQQHAHTHNIVRQRLAQSGACDISHSGAQWPFRFVFRDSNSYLRHRQLRRTPLSTHKFRLVYVASYSEYIDSATG